MTHRTIAWFLFLVLGCSSGCTGTDTNVDNTHNTGGAAGTGGGAGASGGSGGQAGGCADHKKGPSMVSIPKVGGGTTCIDSTEVTREQYAEFVEDAASGKFQQPVECASNTTVAPDADCMESQWVCKGDGCSNHPQVCVDWCDAAAYCEWAGKRLCGRVGGGRLDLKNDDPTDPKVCEWMNACSSGKSVPAGNNIWPYGTSYDSSRCNGYENEATGCKVAPACTTLPVGSLENCTPQGSFAGVYDLSGNVEEWTNNCEVSDSGTLLTCAVRGGSFEIGLPTSGLGESCGFGTPIAVSASMDFVGFRCCDELENGEVSLAKKPASKCLWRNSGDTFSFRHRRLCFG